MSNPNVTRQFRQSGQTPYSQVFDGIQEMNWVVDISRPLRGVYIDIPFQLQNTGGSTDGANTTDRLLKILGTLEVVLNTDKGDFNIVPAGTPIFQYVRFNESLGRLMVSPLGAHGVGPQTNIYRGGMNQLNLTGQQAIQPEVAGLRLFIPFQCIGAESAEQDFAAYVPQDGDNTMTITITPIDITSTASRAFTPYAPFPGSDRTLAIVDYSGTGTAKAKMYLDQMEKAVLGTGSGKWLPVYERKQFTIAASAAAQTEQLVENWARGGFWHAIGLFEQNLVPAVGPVLNTAILQFPGAVGSPNTQTLARDLVMLANTEIIMEESLLGLIAQQHPSPDLVFYVGAGEDDLAPHVPIVINLTKGRSMFSLPDFSPFVASKQQINFQLNNIPAASTGAEYWDFITLRYVAR